MRNPYLTSAPERREGDSNPRTLAGRRFSRPFHSSALAPLLETGRLAGDRTLDVLAYIGDQQVAWM